jgi:hypothetical protein
MLNIPHPDWALLGIIDITGNAGQHHGLQQPQAYIPCSPSPWYLGNECGDSRRPSEKSILRVAVSRSPKPADWNGLRGRNGLGLLGSEKFQKVRTGRCGRWDQASFRRRVRSRWLGAAESRLAANMWKSACLTPAQALPRFVALSHENPKIALPQTAKCGSSAPFVRIFHAMIEERCTSHICHVGHGVCNEP